LCSKRRVVRSNAADLAGDPRPTTVAGYRCDATDHGDVSISLDIVCRRGDRYVTAGAADDE
jgi:hypothetical protein